MDTIYILTHSVICYRYELWLKPRVQVIDDWRLRTMRWTGEEQEQYEKETDDFINYADGPEWWETVLDRNREREPEKSLVEIDYDSILGYIFDKRLRNGYYQRRGERICVLTFFHNDDDTANRLFDGNTPERRLFLKQYYLECVINHPFIKTVEIPYDFTLTEDYLADLFEEHGVSNIAPLG